MGFTPAANNRSSFTPLSDISMPSDFSPTLFSPSYLNETFKSNLSSKNAPSSSSDPLIVLAEASATKDTSKRNEYIDRNSRTFISSPFGFELSPSINGDIDRTREEGFLSSGPKTTGVNPSFTGLSEMSAVFSIESGSPIPKLTTSSSPNITITDLSQSTDYDLNGVPNLNNIKRKRQVVSSIENIGSDMNLEMSFEEKMDKEKLKAGSTLSSTKSLNDSIDSIAADTTTTDEAETEAETTLMDISTSEEITSPDQDLDTTVVLGYNKRTTRGMEKKRKLQEGKDINNKSSPSTATTKKQGKGLNTRLQQKQAMVAEAVAAAKNGRKTRSQSVKEDDALDALVAMKNSPMKYKKN